MSCLSSVTEWDCSGCRLKLTSSRIQSFPAVSHHPLPLVSTMRRLHRSSRPVGWGNGDTCPSRYHRLLFVHRISSFYGPRRSTIQLRVTTTVHGSRATRAYLVLTKAPSYPRYTSFGLQQVLCDSRVDMRLILGHQSCTRHT